MANDVAAAYLEDMVRSFKASKKMSERALAMVPDAHLHTELDTNSNCLAVVIKHMAGNLRSRFTDFLTTDGEKPDRQRDREFEVTGQETRDELTAAWEAGWATALQTIAALEPGDVLRVVTIRGEAHTVLQALDRAVTHMAYHAGQIVYLARHFAGDRWESLTIPKGQSDAFNAGRRG